MKRGGAVGQLKIPAEPKKYQATYRDLVGVDLSSEQRNISTTRASSCVNMFKRYQDGFTDFIETRPGLRVLHDYGSRINGVYFLEIPQLLLIVHAGTSLYRSTGIDGIPEEIYSGVLDTYSTAFVHEKALYFLDGEHYLRYDGAACTAVTGYVPATSIARTPEGGGTVYQTVNMLTNRRKNSFRGDGTSKEYHLDATGLDDSTVTAEVDGETTTAFTVNKQTGIVTFSTAPAMPGGGDDNVVIEFGVSVTDNVTPCTRAIPFDNRFFYFGNPAYPNVFWHCELDNPAYISDVGYVKVGDSNSRIVDMAVQDGSLIVLKDGNQDASSIFVHTPTLDYDLGRVYPSSQSVISEGCVGGARSFRDDLVYMSARGVEGITSPTVTNSERSLKHRSTLIDSALAAESLSSVQTEEWNGYYCALFGDTMYLADSRGTYSANGSFEYEWFYWTDLNIGTATGRVLKQYEGELYFGTDGGDLCVFDGDKDGTDPVYCEWVSRAENGNTNAMLKTVKPKGAYALLKTMPNSLFKIAVETDKESRHDILTVRMSGFSFADVDFNSISFTTDSDNIIQLPIKEKKWKWLKLHLYSPDKRFGLGQLNYEYTIGNYIK